MVKTVCTQALMQPDRGHLLLANGTGYRTTRTGGWMRSENTKPGRHGGFRGIASRSNLTEQVAEEVLGHWDRWEGVWRLSCSPMAQRLLHTVCDTCCMAQRVALYFACSPT